MLVAMLVAMAMGGPAPTNDWRVMLDSPVSRALNKAVKEWTVPPSESLKIPVPTIGWQCTLHPTDDEHARMIKCGALGTWKNRLPSIGIRVLQDEYEILALGRGPDGDIYTVAVIGPRVAKSPHR